MQKLKEYDDMKDRVSYPHQKKQWMKSLTRFMKIKWMNDKINTYKNIK